MNIFDRLRSKKQKEANPKTENAVLIRESVITEASKMAEVVENGVRNGDYQAMNQQLVTLFNEQQIEEPSVFESTGHLIYAVPIVLVCVSSVFL